MTLISLADLMNSAIRARFIDICNEYSIYNISSKDKFTQNLLIHCMIEEILHIKTKKYGVSKVVFIHTNEINWGLYRYIIDDHQNMADLWDKTLSQTCKLLPISVYWCKIPFSLLESIISTGEDSSYSYYMAEIDKISQYKPKFTWSKYKKYMKTHGLNSMIKQLESNKAKAILSVA